jgi:hypothetical protein
MTTTTALELPVSLELVQVVRGALDTGNGPVRAEDVALAACCSYTDALWTLRVMEHAGELASKPGRRSAGYAPVFYLSVSVDTCPTGA